MPVQATEQYPRGLGATVPELARRLPERPDKVAFSSLRRAGRGRALPPRGPAQGGAGRHRDARLRPAHGPRPAGRRLPRLHRRRRGRRPLPHRPRNGPAPPGAGRRRADHGRGLRLRVDRRRRPSAIQGDQPPGAGANASTCPRPEPTNPRARNDPSRPAEPADPPAARPRPQRRPPARPPRHGHAAARPPRSGVPGDHGRDAGDAAPGLPDEEPADVPRQRHRHGRHGDVRRQPDRAGRQDGGLRQRLLRPAHGRRGRPGRRRGHGAGTGLGRGVRPQPDPRGAAKGAAQGAGHRPRRDLDRRLAAARRPRRPVPRVRHAAARRYA